VSGRQLGCRAWTQADTSGRAPSGPNVPAAAALHQDTVPGRSADVRASAGHHMAEETARSDVVFSRGTCCGPTHCASTPVRATGTLPFHRAGTLAAQLVTPRKSVHDGARTEPGTLYLTRVDHEGPR
jgi:hypothetical protein